MLRLLTFVSVLALVGCAAVSGWLQSDAGGDPSGVGTTVLVGPESGPTVLLAPESGPTKGELLADGLAAGAPVAGPFAGIVLIAAQVLAGYSHRKKKPE